MRHAVTFTMKKHTMAGWCVSFDYIPIRHTIKTCLILCRSPCAAKTALIHQGMDFTRPKRCAVVSDTKLLAADPVSCKVGPLWIELVCLFPQGILVPFLAKVSNAHVHPRDVKKMWLIKQGHRLPMFHRLVLTLTCLLSMCHSDQSASAIGSLVICSTIVLSWTTFGT